MRAQSLSPRVMRSKRSSMLREQLAKEKNARETAEQFVARVLLRNSTSFNADA